MKKIALKKILDTVLRYKIVVIVAITVVTILLGTIASSVSIDMGMYTLLPEDDEEVKEYKEISKNFGGFDNLIIVIAGIDPERMQFAAEAIVTEMDDLKEVVRTVDYKFPYAFIKEHFLLYMNEKDFNSLINSFTQNPISLGENSIFEIGETNDDLLESLKEQYYFNNEHDKLLIFLRPTNSNHDMIFFERMVTEVEAKLDKIMIDFPDLSLNLTGMAKMMEEQQTNLNKNIVIVSVVALIMILLLFIIAYRKIFAPILATIPIVVALIWTLGINQLVIGRLNLVTSIFAVILLGLGIDFSIHFITKFYYELEKGNSTYESLVKVFNQTMPGILTGAITTSVAFYILMISDFIGLKELGFIAGTGIVMCLFSVIVFLPALISLFANKFKVSNNKYQVKSSRYTDFLLKKKVAIFMVVIILITLPYLSGFKVEFNYNAFELLPDVPSYILQKELSEEFDNSFEYSIFKADNVNEAREQLEKIKKTEIYALIDSPVYLIPENQEERLLRIKELASQESAYSAINSQLMFKELADGIEKMIQTGEITIDKLPNEIKDKYLGKDGSIGTYVFIKRNMWDEEPIKEVAKVLRNIDSSVSGTNFMLLRLVEYIKSDLVRSSLAVFLALILLVYLDFRNIKQVLITITPVVLGFIWLLGLMSYFNIKFNSANIVAFPLIIGIGIDNGIHMVHNYAANKSRDIKFMMLQSGKAVLVTSLTSMIGFGLLYFVGDPIVSGLGILLFLGVLLCLIITVTILPILLSLFGKYIIPWENND